MLRYYFEELRYHTASVAVHGDNEASLRLHEKLGFVREGAFRRHVFAHGMHLDLVWYGMTAEEFNWLHA